MEQKVRGSIHVIYCATITIGNGWMTCLDGFIDRGIMCHYVSRSALASYTMSMREEMLSLKVDARDELPLFSPLRPLQYSKCSAGIEAHASDNGKLNHML